MGFSPWTPAMGTMGTPGRASPTPLWDPLGLCITLSSLTWGRTKSSSIASAAALEAFIRSSVQITQDLCIQNLSHALDSATVPWKNFQDKNHTSQQRLIMQEVKHDTVTGSRTGGMDFLVDGQWGSARKGEVKSTVLAAADTGDTLQKV